jgi:hypothetical protein
MGKKIWFSSESYFGLASVSYLSEWSICIAVINDSWFGLPNVDIIIQYLPLMADSDCCNCEQNMLFLGR